MLLESCLRGVDGGFVDPTLGFGGTCACLSMEGRLQTAVPRDSSATPSGVVRYVLTTALLSTAVLTANNASSDAPSTSSEHAARWVQTARVERSDEIRELRFPSVTRSAKEARVSFTLGGRISGFEVSEGDRVRAGTPLARIEATSLENTVLERSMALSRAQIEWRRARRDRERMDRLVEVGGRARRDLEVAQAIEQEAWASVMAAKASLSEAERQLDETTILAPFDGTVTKLRLDPGEYAVAGAPVLVLSSSEAIEIEIRVPESVLRGIRLGSVARVDFPLARIPAIDAPIRSITHGASGPGALFPVVVRLPTRLDLAPGLAAEVAVPIDRGDALLVPVEALVHSSPGHSSVLRLRDGRIDRVPVRVLDLEGGRVRVEGPLADGDEIVVAGHAGLLEGDVVRVDLPAAPHLP